MSKKSAMKRSQEHSSTESAQFPVSPWESDQVLLKILQPILPKVIELRTTMSGIVFVVHRPGRVAKLALKKLGIQLPRAETMAFGATCANAARSLGQDLITRRWLTFPPTPDEIKVFLIAGDGTALLTIKIGVDGVLHVEKEQDGYPC